MAFLRFTRDKRGYEYFYLVHSSQRRGRSTSRVLYWYRTPPNVKVGREPFDEQVRRELEKQNPDVVFDWRKILETPIPSADAEMWRERRRAERAAKALRRTEVQEAEPDAVEPDDEGDAAPGDESPADDVASAADCEPAITDEAVPPETVVHVLEAAAAAVPLDSAIPPDLCASETSNEAVNPANAPADLRSLGSPENLRRKRRRRRRRHGPPGSPGSGGGPPAGPAGDV
jgi:hypothetical protein